MQAETPKANTRSRDILPLPDIPRPNLTTYDAKDPHTPPSISRHRGIYHKGWTAVTKHRTPWETGAEVKTLACDDDIWELYDTNTDWTQAHDLAREFPDKLRELQRLWLIEAVKYQVVPLDGRFAARGTPELAGRPTLIRGKRQLLFGGMGRLTEHCVVWFKNASFSLTAEVDVPDGGAEGVIVAQGRIEQTEALFFSADETPDVGSEYGSPVTTDYTARKFIREVNWVEIDVGEDDHSHMIRPEDRLQVAMAIQ